MRKYKLSLFCLLSLFLCGCSVVNFSALYYTPPPNYETEVYNLWEEIKAKIPLKTSHIYSLSIVSDKSTQTPGIPENASGSIHFPDLLVKYVYQNYYDNRFAILTCFIVHELAHTEFNLPDKPPEQHYICDQRALEELLLPYTDYGVKAYYSSLIVLDKYWSARKGLLGNTLNIAYNLTVLWYGGVFVDWISNDLDTRLVLMSESYDLSSKDFIFKQDKTPKGKSKQVTKELKDNKASSPKANFSFGK